MNTTISLAEVRYPPSALVVPSASTTPTPPGDGVEAEAGLAGPQAPSRTDVTRSPAFFSTHHHP